MRVCLFLILSTFILVLKVKLRIYHYEYKQYAVGISQLVKTEQIPLMIGHTD